MLLCTLRLNSDNVEPASKLRCMARIPRNLLWCSHIYLCIFLWYKRHKVWKRSSLFKGDVATLSASHLASAVLFLLQPFCLSGIYNIFAYLFNVCTAIEIHGKLRGHKGNGPLALFLCKNAFLSGLGMDFLLMNGHLIL